MPPEVVRRLCEEPQGDIPELWQKIAQLGWLGLVLPESYGGSGLSFVDLTIVLEEMGRVLFPLPFFASVALGGLILLEAGSEAQKQQMLPRLAKGELKLSLALLEADGRYDPRGIGLRASIRGNRAMLNGTKLFVVDAHLADYVLCVARTRGGRDWEAGISLFLIDMKSPGVVCTPLLGIDQTRRPCEVSFTRVSVPLDQMLGDVTPPGPCCSGPWTKPQWRCARRWSAGPKRPWTCASTMPKHACSSAVKSAHFKP